MIAELVVDESIVRTYVKWIRITLGRRTHLQAVPSPPSAAHRSTLRRRLSPVGRICTRCVLGCGSFLASWGLAHVAHTRLESQALGALAASGLAEAKNVPAIPELEPVAIDDALDLERQLARNCARLSLPE